MRHLIVSILFLFFVASLGGCAFFSWLFSSQQGAVRFYSGIPSQCPQSRGLKQKEVRPVHSKEELIRHYGISFVVRFRDQVSPRLYGALYYLDRERNLYCMALPDGRFAVFHNSKVGGRDNVMQEICYPIKKCE